MTFLSALILGLFSSAHCAGMCGGFQMALQQPQAVRSSSQQISNLLLLNAGRLSCYLLAALLLSFLASSLVTIMSLLNISRVLRIISAIILILLGIQMISSLQRPFALLEKYGGGLWQRIKTKIKVHSAKKNHLYINGLIWGLLPCGLVYSVLLSALFAGSVQQALLIMLGFGLGTLPSMLLTGVAYQHFKHFFYQRGMRIAGGVLFIVGGLLMLLSPLFISHSLYQRFPVLLNQFFCIGL